MEVAPGIHRVEGQFAGRYLYQHMLVGDRVALVDSGIPSTPEELLFPYLRQLGVDPSRIDYLVCTHPDADHMGGNAAVKRVAGSCRVLGHILDVHWLAEPDRLVAERYDGFRTDHGIHDSDHALEQLRALCGEATPVDVELLGGEWLNLGGWRVQVIHSPGHSEGHLSVWDPRSRTLLIADASMGKALPFVDGRAALAPTYTHPTPYCETARKLRGLQAERLLTAHFGLMEGEDVSRFFDESIERAERIEALALDALDTAGAPVKLSDLVERVDEELGPLPADSASTWAHPLSGHLDELEAQERIRMVRAADGRKAWVSIQRATHGPA
jgi:glyoxylase-like metal-dependent hydrolase (beta-lactamase superfamily II)